MDNVAAKAWILHRCAESPDAHPDSGGIILSIEDKMPDGVIWDGVCTGVLELRRDGFIEILETVRTYASNNEPVNFFVILIPRGSENIAGQ